MGDHNYDKNFDSQKFAAGIQKLQNQPIQPQARPQSSWLNILTGSPRDEAQAQAAPDYEAIRAQNARNMGR